VLKFKRKLLQEIKEAKPVANNHRAIQEQEGLDP